MQKRRRTKISVALLGLSACLQTPVCAAASDSPPGPEETYKAPAQAVTLEEYAARLHHLRDLVNECAQTTGGPACDWKLVGPDAAVRTPYGVRNVQFIWLRSAMQHAAEASASKVGDSAAKQKILENAAEGLHDAGLHLDQDLARQPASLPPARDVTTERTALKKILSTGGYAQQMQPTLLEKWRNAFLDWLLRKLNAVSASQGSQILVDLLLISLMVVVCGAMLWWFARKIQNQRLVMPPPGAPDPSAPSSLDWENWLEQAKIFAARQQWREAIRHVYWSAISRLESRGYWPADRTRTPREYLGLLSARPEALNDLHTHLRFLTRSFEQTWYGDQAAGQVEFEHACALLERLAG